MSTFRAGIAHLAVRIRNYRAPCWLTFVYAGQREVRGSSVIACTEFSLARMRSSFL
jgi:hypothetical protein